ncbi:MAG: GNAT family N-acetyltransferase [Chthonomonas sp.]|nr:GNAT family N-acetyltransferase [Chthonomonas sp.]
MPDFAAPTPLTAEHEVANFDCGKPPLNDFLKEHALARQNAMLSRTYVVTPVGSLHVAAYYTLAHVSSVREQAPKKIARGMPDTIPALLLARLAIDETFQRQGLGKSLFSDALRRTWAVMSQAAAPVRFFVVDAKDEEARAYYEKLGMTPSPTNPMRLFLHYKDLQAIFEA